MPNYFESIPASRPNLQFPGGDTDQDYQARALEIISELGLSGDKQRPARLGALRLAEIGAWRSSGKNEKTYRNLGFLAECWADTFEEDSTRVAAVAKVGLLNTIALARRSNLFPVNFADFTDEIATMFSYDTDRIELFGSEAWDSMAKSHPNIHNALKAWHQYLQTYAGIGKEDELNDLLGASIALPYVLSAATRMQGYQSVDIERQLQKLISSESAEQ